MLIMYSEIFDFPVPGGPLMIINCLIRRRKLFAYTYATHMLKTITEPRLGCWPSSREGGCLIFVIFLQKLLKRNVVYEHLNEASSVLF